MLSVFLLTSGMQTGKLCHQRKSAKCESRCNAN